jgi:hypothetical protein
MDRNDAPSTLYHKLNQKGARGEGTPRPGKNPEGDERGTAGTSYDNRGPATNKLTVVSAELPSVSLCANSGKTYTLEWPACGNRQQLLRFTGATDRSSHNGAGLGDHRGFTGVFRREAFRLLHVGRIHILARVAHLYLHQQQITNGR